MDNFFSITNRNIWALFLFNLLIIAPCVIIGMNISRLFYPRIYSSWIYSGALFALGAFLMYLGVKGAALRLLYATKNKERFLSWNSIIELISAAIGSFGFGVISSALTVGVYLFFS